MTTARRLSRDEFHARLAGLERDDLAKVLWTLYWRGGTPVRERIEDLVEPRPKEAKAQEQQPPDARATLSSVTEFATLARSGAYLGRDRRVSPKERTRWRLTFRALAQQSQQALLGDDVETAARAVSTLVDLAQETKDTDYFRSEDPMEAARFVISDAVRAMWSRLRDTAGANRMVDRAVPQLVRWEERYGWTRRGEGWVAERETSLATVLADLLVVPDLWVAAAERYAETLGTRAGAGHGTGGVGRRKRSAGSGDLAEWNALLAAHLVGSDQQDVIDQLSAYPAFATALARAAEED